MHFPQLINIAKRDKVLEVGPGGTPFYRSNVLLEKRYASTEEYYAQCGGQRKLITDKTVVYYKGGRFPFADREFDYVICSHVLEHVDDVRFFVSELMRVAGRGYLEFPTILYEYIYNFDTHKNILLRKGDILYWMKKSNTPINYFCPVNNFFLETLKFGQDQLIVPQKEIFFQGFEWADSICLAEATEIVSLCPDPKQWVESMSRSAKIRKDFIFFYKVWKKLSEMFYFIKRSMIK